MFLLTVFTSQAQKLYFIYIQSESNQPFFIKMDEKVQSSTSSGYLLLSKLRDTVYNFSIGFPENKWPDHKFSVAINRKDHGYLLKNFGEKGWGLYNLQTLAIQMGTTATTNKDVSKNDDNNVSKFTEILSKAADDPSLKEKPAKPNEESKLLTEPVVAKKEVVDSVIIQPVSNNSSVKAEEKQVSIDEKKISDTIEIKADQEIVENKVEQVSADNNTTSIGTSYRPSLIKKWSESSTTEGFGLVYIDEIKEGEKDTIRLFIPNPKTIEVPPVPQKDEELKEEKKFLEIADTVQKKEGKEVEVKTVVKEKDIEKISGNSDNKHCQVKAEDADFFELRKQMAAAENDDDMTSLAKKVFKQKCFTTLQVKNLSVLFLTDQGKYSFFDVAYNYVLDSINFPSLQAEIKDEYYINRFKAMLRN